MFGPPLRKRVSVLNEKGVPHFSLHGSARQRHRFLRHVLVSGEIFDLVGEVHHGERDLQTNKQGEPVEVDGRNLGNRLRRLPLWRELEGKYAAQGKWLRPYSFRDS